MANINKATGLFLEYFYFLLSPALLTLGSVIVNQQGDQIGRSIMALGEFLEIDLGEIFSSKTIAQNWP